MSVTNRANLPRTGFLYSSGSTVSDPFERSPLTTDGEPETPQRPSPTEAITPSREMGSRLVHIVVSNPHQTVVGAVFCCDGSKRTEPLRGGSAVCTIGEYETLSFETRYLRTRVYTMDDLAGKKVVVKVTPTGIEVRLSSSRSATPPPGIRV